MVEIKKYDKQRDEEKVMRMLEEMGKEWACYWEQDVYTKYCKALEHAITYVAYDDDDLCGYSRSLNDHDFYIYVCDLLVKPSHRGANIGKKLMEILLNEYPDQTVFVMSDVDSYYEKLGYKKEGSVFEVNPQKK